MTCRHTINELANGRQGIENAGIYVHVPFCVQKCLYCDFYSTTDMSLIPVFLNSLRQEVIQLSAHTIKFDSLYIGGGTPSILSPVELQEMIISIKRAFSIQNAVETTIEVNPGTVSAADLKRYRAAGIDRLSIGIQSFNDHNLRFLGRIHTSAEARQVFNYSREAGFDNSSIDMIYGLPHQDQKSWLQDLKAAVELKPEHISCYMLTYAPGTLLYRQRKDRNIKPLPDRRLRRLYEITTQFLSAKGYDQYEISNFARQTSGSSDRFVSKHNFKYWTFAPYIGLGPSAHSFLSPVRFWNVADLRQYAQKLNKDCLPIQEMERLTPEQQAMEAIYLGLRLTEGLSIDFFNERFGVDFLSAHGELIKRLKQNGYLNIEDSRCKLTLMGMVLHDSISAMFISHEPSVHKQNC